ncbi:AMP-binding protein [Nocardioides sp.]|uniref:AMP-binding protein n=1 Tax=Nocardioides sp. TaxID=35761 RepID=UPI0019B8DB97|nr:AMP-binding protein [Nocardioides sp.]MBC7276720.1 AMP-binding protein [Nocardioides sp.]
MFSTTAAKARTAGSAAKILAGSGIVRPVNPIGLARTGLALARWGTGPAGGFIGLARRYPRRTAVIDELGSLTYADLDRRSNAIARALAARGVGEGDGVAIMCRNHRGFVDATLAVAKLGADALYLNTAFAGPQLVGVLERDQPALIIHDEEFTGLLSAATSAPRLVAWVDSDDPAETLESLVSGDARPVPPPKRHGRIVILTSGTTGAPKSAPRQEAGIDAAVALMSRMPMKDGWRCFIAAPLFHTWGIAHLLFAELLGTTMILRRRFDPEDALATLAEGQADSFVVIPVMMQRILSLPEEKLAAFDLEAIASRLKAVASSGSALPGDLALEWMDRFGDSLYNVYGSTEVSYASIADPVDLREAPTSAGKVPWGTQMRILDGDGAPVPDGEAGRIFVGNGLLFEGYTSGGGKEVVDGLMATGDVGRFGPDGRLYVEGRDDDMIVSGGENVFPQEVEDCLMRHPLVADAACVGVDDADFGKRLRGFVVLVPGAETEAGDVDVTLKDWVKENLARFKVPREIVLIDALPRNATGKVLRRELATWDDEAAGPNGERVAGQ